MNSGELIKRIQEVDEADDNKVLAVLMDRRVAELQQEAQMGNPMGIAMAVSWNWEAQPWFKLEIPKEQEILIGEWWSGKLTYHQPCKKCKVELDRSHGSECSGAIKLLEEKCCNLVQSWKSLENKTAEEDKPNQLPFERMWQSQEER